LNSGAILGLVVHLGFQRQLVRVYNGQGTLW